MPLNQKGRDRVEHIFKFMCYDQLSDAQHNLVISFENQFKRRNDLSPRQLEILNSIKSGSSTISHGIMHA